MTIAARVGIIGGNGWLGNALASSAVTKGVIDPARLVLSSRSGTRGAIDIPGATWTRDNGELARQSDVILLSVRPEQYPAVVIDASGKLVVSLMAAIPAAIIAKRTGAERIVRSMPNAAMSIGKSFTPWFAAAAVTPEDKRLVQTLFECCGDGDEVPEERHIDYCSGLCGSGAAFPGLLAQAMIEQAVAQGLPLSFARRAAKSVLIDASQLLAEHEDPAPVVQAMIDYRGTTAAALQTMIDCGFKTAVGAGLDAAAKKAAAMAAGLTGQLR
ncbi:pyrroline-5-carboxylate reductase family protein [Lichenifustis flavocetrariae]|uniref:Pyrroline-5-carboxylate reductase n=1 Tax=Lichenifustis flavocetrariae TaxID=2949735 RepID=A0AA41Z4A1_9HYPH|nr:pyrroline-5-carboxylate reductase dimerization domain-containing protein [Lichenifustis flavocetrariae]MCW6512673.1 NAD(P)-binding domain-containing protein [Lichenifustis flavocetrariae]